ncbi:uncharacterized protein RSE6_05241 [Rhynchosporium secalis]|uniref:Secreted protein n=1 Tax=Rhynchosporium secalis TaxID=38038 RepID=A0A1E1M7B7_RHYSE|nr:uncharacterized protein RSE6_05241 [Rhynchosporium secalis]
MDVLWMLLLATLSFEGETDRVSVYMPARRDTEPTILVFRTACTSSRGVFAESWNVAIELQATFDASLGENGHPWCDDCSGSSRKYDRAIGLATYRWP